MNLRGCIHDERAFITRVIKVTTFFDVFLFMHLLSFWTFCLFVFQVCEFIFDTQLDSACLDIMTVTLRTLRKVRIFQSISKRISNFNSVLFETRIRNFEYSNSSLATQRVRTARATCKYCADSKHPQ